MSRKKTQKKCPHCSEKIKGTRENAIELARRKLQRQQTALVVHRQRGLDSLRLTLHTSSSVCFTLIMFLQLEHQLQKTHHQQPSLPPLGVFSWIKVQTLVCLVFIFPTRPLPRYLLLPYLFGCFPSPPFHVTSCLNRRSLF